MLSIWLPAEQAGLEHHHVLVPIDPIRREVFVHQSLNNSFPRAQSPHSVLHFSADFWPRVWVSLDFSAASAPPCICEALLSIRWIRGLTALFVSQLPHLHRTVIYWRLHLMWIWCLRFICSLKTTTARSASTSSMVSFLLTISFGLRQILIFWFRCLCCWHLWPDRFSVLNVMSLVGLLQSLDTKRR
jgi:hypothetical protein